MIFLNDRHVSDTRFYARQPKPAKNVIAEVIQRRGYARVLSQENLQQAWQEALRTTPSGELLAKHSFPGRLRRGTLEVMVANSTFVQELTFEKTTLLARLRELSPGQNIRNLRFRVGEVPQQTLDER